MASSVSVFVFVFLFTVVRLVCNLHRTTDRITQYFKIVLTTIWGHDHGSVIYGHDHG